MIAPAPFDYDRGKSIRIRQTVEHLSKLGYSIDVLTYPVGRSVDKDNIQIKRASRIFKQADPSIPGVSVRQLFSNCSLLRQGYRHLKTENYDVIHAHDVDGVIIGHLSRLLTRTDVPLVYDMHGMFRELSSHYEIIDSDWIINGVEQYLYDSSDYIITNWPHISENIETTTPHSLIMDEPDQTVCSHLERMHEEMRGEQKEQELDKYVLYTGNYAPYQGIDLLFESFRKMETDEPVQLVMTGDAPDEYVVEDPNIVYTGYVSEKRLAELLYGANVLVSPRQTDGFPPLKMLYYIRTETPIVATDRTCHRSILTDIEGVWFSAETPAAFGNAIQEALNDSHNYPRRTMTDNKTKTYQQIYKEIVS